MAEQAGIQRYRWQVVFGSVLVVLSAVFYAVHYLVFRDTHHIFIYLVGDIAFVPIEVLLVTLIIHRMLRIRERRALLRKLNMVIGSFFSEVGFELMGRFIMYDPKHGMLSESLIVSAEWNSSTFLTVKQLVKRHDLSVQPTGGDLEELRGFLEARRGFLLTLLQNPNLLEHESFTDLLWAVFHLTEELVYRADVRKATDTDLDHLRGDVVRAYRCILLEWLQYIWNISRRIIPISSHWPYGGTPSIRMRISG